MAIKFEFTRIAMCISPSQLHDKIQLERKHKMTNSQP